MYNKTKQRIDTANKISTEELIALIKEQYPERFDQMLIENEQRTNYFYVKHQSTAFERKYIHLEFPLFSHQESTFKQEIINPNNEPEFLQKTSFLRNILNQNRYLAREIHSENSTFVNLEFKMKNSNKVAPEQPYYYIPSKCEISQCKRCAGQKYTPCTNSECNGRHIYDCNKCNALGEINCDECRAIGYKKCTKCSGKGEHSCNSCYGKGNKKCNYCYGGGTAAAGSKNKCTNCYGRGFVECKRCRNGMVNCSTCSAKGEIRCGKCSGRGRITCSKCSGKRQITCSTCYGDHQENRYGKVDCSSCYTAGKFGFIPYIDTKIITNYEEFFFTDNIEIPSENFSNDLLKSCVNTEASMEMTYQVFNDKNFQKYDEYSELYSGKMLSRIGVDKNTYPKLLQEEIYYESIPCVVFTYTHILSATQHKVSILGIDNQKKIVFHSNPVQILEQKETFTDKYKEWLNKAFSTKRYLDKIDRRNEIVLMLHMAKADGKIEESEKKYLTGVITCLKDFNQKEKAKLFELMNANPLPELVPSDVYFSSDERIEEVKRKISEIMLTDGEEEEKEKLKLQEISTLIENAKATKPKKISVFFKTWQVSIPIILFIIWILTLVLFN